VVFEVWLDGVPSGILISLPSDAPDYVLEALFDAAANHEAALGHVLELRRVRLHDE